MFCCFEDHLLPWVRRTKCILLVREFIERYKNQFAPNFRPSPPSKATVDKIYNYHIDKWLTILNDNPNNDTRVLELHEFLQQGNISYNQFAAIMADVFAATSKSIHFPFGVANVTTEEIIQVFEDDHAFCGVKQKKMYRNVSKL